MNHLLAMGAFALASSITPGPVNFVALGTGARFGFRAALPHVTGATAGFTLLLLVTGLGLGQIVQHYPGLTRALTWVGAAFFLYLAVNLADLNTRRRPHPATASDPVPRVPGDTPPNLLLGASLQWVNPKAWLAALGGTGALVQPAAGGSLGVFAALYFVICFAAIALWAYAGSRLGLALSRPGALRGLNRTMALLLALSALSLLGW